MKKTWLVVLALLVNVVLLWAAPIGGFQDWLMRSAPGSNPPTGQLRTWADTATSTMRCIDHSGAACFFNSPFNTLTTTGTSGAATLTSGVLNVPIYAGGGSTFTMRAIGMGFSGGGTALTSGSVQYVTVPFACSIQQWDITVDAGTATLDVWKIASGPADWAGASGTVNTLGTAVTWVSGTTFVPDSAGLRITINGVVYTIATYNSSTSLTLTSTAGTQSAVSFSGPGSTIPTVTNTIVASAPPTISSGTARGSSALTGWTTGIVKNDILGFSISAVSTATTLSLVLECQQ